MFIPSVHSCSQTTYMSFCRHCQQSSTMSTESTNHRKASCNHTWRSADTPQCAFLYVPQAVAPLDGLSALHSTNATQEGWVPDDLEPDRRNHTPREMTHRRRIRQRTRHSDVSWVYFVQLREHVGAVAHMYPFPEPEGSETYPQASVRARHQERDAALNRQCWTPR